MTSQHSLKWTSVALLACLAWGAAGCQQPTSQQARREVEAQLAARQEGERKAMELYERGRKAEAAGKPDEALKRYNEAVAADEDNLYAWMAIGRIEFGRDHFYSAGEAFTRSVRLAPTRYEPHFNMGSVFEYAGRYADAVREYEAALRLSPDQVEVMENLARTYVLTRQNNARTRELAERAIKLEDRPEWRRWLARQLLDASTTRPATQSTTAQSPQ